MSVEVIIVFSVVAAFIFLFFAGVSNDANQKLLNETVQKCPKCFSSSGFYHQPHVVTKPAIGIGGALGATYQESYFLNFCKKCDVEVLPRLLFDGNLSTNTREYANLRDQETSSTSQMQLAQLAREGHASALASFTWRALEIGEHETAIALFEETRESLREAAGGPKKLSWELANCDSNHALNLLATGKTIDEVTQYWEKNTSSGHNECNFYVIIAKVKLGELDPTFLTEIFAKTHRNEFLQTLIEGSTSSGWYKTWTKEILEEFGPSLRA